MNSTESNNTGGAFSTLWRTIGVGISLTTVSSTVLAVVFALALDGCSKIATHAAATKEAPRVTTVSQPAR